MFGSIIGGLLGRNDNKRNNSANLTAVRETNEANKQIAAGANAAQQHQVNQAYQRDTAAVREARAWDQRSVREARQYDASAIQGERKYNQAVAKAADSQDRNRFLQDREWSKQQAALAETRDRTNYLADRTYGTEQQLAAEEREQGRFLENRGWATDQQLAAEGRQRGYAAEDLADARAYADPAAERARLEAAGFNPLGRGDTSSGMNNIGGAIASAPGYMPAAGAASAGSPGSPAARAIEGMGTPGAILPSSGGSASSQIARSQMAKLNVFDPVVAHLQAPVMQADNSLGRGIADAFESYADQQVQEKEYELRKSQLEIEQQRLSELMQRATMRPIVGGVYSGQVGIGRQAHLEAGGSSSPSSPVAVGEAPPSAAGLPSNVKPETFPMYVDVFDQKTKRYVQIPNPDLMDAGPLEVATGMGMIYGKQAADVSQDATGKQILNAAGSFAKHGLRNSPAGMAADYVGRLWNGDDTISQKKPKDAGNKPSRKKEESTSWFSW